MGFTDEEWAEVARDMPAADDPFIRKYVDGREALVAREDKQRSGSADSLLDSRAPPPLTRPD